MNDSGRFLSKTSAFIASLQEVKPQKTLTESGDTNYLVLKAIIRNTTLLLYLYLFVYHALMYANPRQVGASEAKQVVGMQVLIGNFLVRLGRLGGGTLTRVGRPI